MLSMYGNFLSNPENRTAHQYFSAVLMIAYFNIRFMGKEKPTIPQVGYRSFGTGKGVVYIEAYVIQGVLICR